MLFHGHTILFLIGVTFSLVPFIGAFRRLPRWIRFALAMSGVSLFLGAVIGFALERFRPQLSRQAQLVFYSQELVIYGIGLGIILLLIFSGEIFKALRRLDARHLDRHS